VVRRHPQTGARHLDLLRWGLLPYWTRSPPRRGGRSMRTRRPRPRRACSRMRWHERLGAGSCRAAGQGA
jgi:hypothetical protein